MYKFMSVFYSVIILSELDFCSTETTSSQMTTEDSVQSKKSKTEHRDLPEGWSDFCMEVNNKSFTDVISFKCTIDGYNSGCWSYEEMRNHIAPRSMKYRFDIECLHGANISLRWPFKARNLKELKVQNCILTEFYGDYENKMLATFQDELEYLSLSNVVAMVDIYDLVYFAGTIVNITQDTLCGNDHSLIEMTMSNLTYNFGASTETFFQNLLNETTGEHNIKEDPVMNKAQNLYTDIFEVDHVCNYKRLKKYDYSINSSPGTFYVDLKTERSSYPVLENLNFSFTPFGEKYSVDDLLNNWAKYYPTLQAMDISHCNIKKLDVVSTIKSIDKGNSHRLVVNLTHNNIKELEVAVLENIVNEEQVFFNFSRNPLNCSCTEDMKELIRFVQEKSKWSIAKYARYAYIQQMQCYFPEQLNGMLLKDLKESLLLCRDVFSLTETIVEEAVVFLSVFSFLLLVVIFILVKFRREIRILTYTRFHILLPCQSEEAFEEKKFDAFVSYSNEDHLWVTSVFENNCIDGLRNFKFCLHHRDFIAGKTITENIIDSIESSRHTIVIVSKNFLDSSYCLYEFEEALRQSISERKRHLLVIMLEDVAQDKMPKVLQTCLKTFTYISKDDKIFMDRLIYSLSYKRRGQMTNNAKFVAAYENELCKETEKQDSTSTFHKNVYESVIPQGSTEKEKTDNYNIFP
ncbi:toll-like receptor 4 [Ostrea edulis]|uniref:toll-like receptor 4 n=1 Tax=Ostrea edulis TaxID=37623 RepID=UPI0024AECA4C|nr:toll-like receptor 4 [Ostrea edulis]